VPRALIIGAGVAGTVVALALKKAGWDPEIYEADDQSAGLNQGVFLTMAVNGLDALRSIDADRIVHALGFPTGKIRSIHHHSRLRAAAIVHGTVTATFVNGATASGDVLIGADGLRSTTRTLIDPAAPTPRYMGTGNVGALTRSTVLDVTTEARDGDYRLIFGKRCSFGYIVSPDREIWWFASLPSENELTPAQTQGAGAAHLKAQLIDLLSADSGPAAAIVRTTAGPILFSNQYDLPRTPVWHRDRMIIIGDAAHAVPPPTGQGVSLACEDAVTLAMCLRDHHPDVAFRIYEQMRRPRIDQVIAWGAKMGNTKIAGPVMRMVRDLALPRILAHGSTPEAVRKQAWLFEHHIEWQ
jgi:FAD-dependent urate hydroxylase